MYSLKELKMKKVKTSKEKIDEIHASLNQKTAQDFIAFAESRRKVQVMARLKYLD